MTQSNKHIVPPARAQGLDPEITAQPRPIPDELALEASAEPDLTVDADDLGARFLRDATEQGDFDPERAWPEESSLIDSPAGDQPVGSTNFVAGNSVWEQTVDLHTRTQGAADLLRAPAPPAAADFDAALSDPLSDPIEVGDNSAHILDASVREFSLFDAHDEDEVVDDAPVAQDERAYAAEESRNREIAQTRSNAGQARSQRSALTRIAQKVRDFASRLQQRVGS